MGQYVGIDLHRRSTTIYRMLTLVFYALRDGEVRCLGTAEAA
jgi:hypothetical protein